MPPQDLLDPFSKEKPCLFNEGKLVSGLGGATLGAPEREWGHVLPQLKEAENLRKVTVCAGKKKKTLIIILISALSPPPCCSRAAGAIEAAVL